MDRRHFQLRRWRALAMFAAALAFQPAAASAQAPRPEHHWAVDWGDRYCTLARQIEGVGEGTTNFFVRVVPGFAWTEFLLWNPDWSAFPIEDHTNVGIVFKPSGERFEAQIIAGRLPHGERFVAISSIPDAWLDRLEVRTGSSCRWAKTRS